MEKTFVMLKPDAVQRGLVGRITARMEQKGLKLLAVKMLQVDRELAAEHYSEHKGKPFYEELVRFITSGPVIAMVWEGKNAVAVVRRIMGSTDPQEAALGTIRGDYALFTGNNVVHGSDSPASAQREIALFFSAEEIVSYKKTDQRWLYGQQDE